MGRKELWKVLAVNGIKTDLWLTADNEVLPLTGKNPELKGDTTKVSKGMTVSFFNDFINMFDSYTAIFYAYDGFMVR